MSIYIRHGKDEKSHGDKVYDTSLTAEGKSDAVKLAKHLTKKYGVPEVIFCSPFRRTRQMAKHMSSIFPRKVPIFVDSELSRFPDVGISYDDKVREDTKKYGFPQQETVHEFKHRVKEHLKIAEIRSIENPTKNYWYITHAIFVKVAAKTSHINAPNRIHSSNWVNLSTKQHSW